MTGSIQSIYLRRTIIIDSITMSRVILFIDLLTLHNTFSVTHHGNAFLYLVNEMKRVTEKLYVSSLMFKTKRDIQAFCTGALFLQLRCAQNDAYTTANSRSRIFVKDYKFPRLSYSDTQHKCFKSFYQVKRHNRPELLLRHNNILALSMLIDVD